jgi:hypothetical protein
MRRGWPRDWCGAGASFHYGLLRDGNGRPRDPGSEYIQRSCYILALLRFEPQGMDKSTPGHDLSRKFAWWRIGERLFYSRRPTAPFVSQKVPLRSAVIPTVGITIHLFGDRRTRQAFQVDPVPSARQPRKQTHARSESLAPGNCRFQSRWCGGP